MMKKNQISLLCKTAVFTALVYVVTAYLHIPVGNGYVHIGDGLIFLAACLLPRPYAISVGACGAFLADALTGYLAWAPGSILIKALTAVLFTCKSKRIVTLRNTCALLPAAIVCAGGYYLYEALIYGNWISPLAAIPSNLMQSAASAILFLVVGLALDQTKGTAKLRGTN